MSWTVADADALYGVSRWGKGVFAVNARGEIEVAAGGMRASLFEIVQTLIREHDIWPPVLLRFPEVIAERMDKLFSAFAEAREEAGYQGRYFGVYPIKVNQQAQVVESIAQLGRRYGWGLEVGSKPELHAAIAMLEHVSGPIVCNGYKDAEFVYLALLARKLGRDVYIVIEKLSELETVLEMARKTGVRPLLGVRCRLSVMPDGFWRESGGDASKFGLSAAEALRCVEMLKREGMLDSLKLLHFHMGSQIPRIQHLKAALREIARYYVELRRLGAPITAIDVGGGLGVDYEGTFSGDPSSVDYTIGEYASNVIWEIKAIADEAGLPHPDILSESGRALVAHHAVLVINVLGVGSEPRRGRVHRPEADAPLPLRQLWDTLDSLEELSPREAFHDAQSYREEVQRLFALGHASLEDLAVADGLFWRVFDQLARRAPEELADEMDAIRTGSADKYFCNFSVFRSLPDAWALGQVFPVAPIHRLNEPPTREGYLVDVTCDSDGRLARFPARPNDPAPKTLPLHAIEEHEEYFIGVFLVGAYQETLGGLHNLFGDTHAVHVRLEDGEPHIEQVVEGESVADVLDWVQFPKQVLLDRVRREVEGARAEGRLSAREATAFLRFYREGLAGYTYLEENLPPAAQ